MVKRLLTASALVLIGSAAAPAVAAAACPASTSITWTGGGGSVNGNWSDAANWSRSSGTGLTPGTGDVVCIPSGVTTEPAVDTAFSVGSVQAFSPVMINATLTLAPANASSFTRVDLTSGGLDGTGTVNISGALDWTGGELGGTGGTTNVLAGATVSVGTGTALLSQGHALVTAGTGSVTGGVEVQDGSRWTNSGSLDVDSAAGISWTSSGGAPAVLDNTGTLTKTASTPATTIFNVPFLNTGTVRASAGTLLFESGGSGTSTGSFTGVAPNGTVEFDGGTFTLGTGATFDGLQVSNGTATVPASDTVSGGSLTLTGAGTLDGNWVVNGTLNVSGGNLTGVGTTTEVSSTGTLTLASQFGATLTIGPSHTLLSAGTGSWGGLTITGDSTSTWNNTGTFHFSGSTSQQLGPGGPTLVNSGTMIQDTPSSKSIFTTLIPPVTNSGTLTSVAPGALVVGQHGEIANTPINDTGVINNATIFGTTTAGSGAAMSGDAVNGGVLVDSGTTVPLTNCSLFNAEFTGGGTVQLLGNTVGNGLPGSRVFDFGAAGSVLVQVPAGSTYSGVQIGVAEDAFVEIDGTANFTGSGSFALDGDATLLNQGTMTFDSATVDAGPNSSYAPPPERFFNTGTISESTANTSTIGQLWNDGTISIHRGQLQIIKFTQGADGVVQIGIGSTTAQSGYGVLALGGGYTADLSGTLAIAADSGYTPSAGDKFDVVTGDGFGGTDSDFDSVTGLNVGNGITLSGAWTNSNFELTAGSSASAVQAAPARSAPNSTTQAAVVSGTAPSAAAVAQRRKRAAARILRRHRVHHRRHGRRHISPHR